MVKLRKWANLKMQTKIIVLTFIVILTSMFFTGFYIANWRIVEMRRDTERNIMNLANVIANAPVVKESLGDRSKQRLIGDYVDKIFESTEGIEVVVVVDMENNRYAHPNQDKIFKQFVGGDQDRVLITGERYISVAEGTIDKEIRAFVPVFKSNGGQVGFVMVGKTITTHNKNVRDIIEFIILSVLLGLSIGIIGAIILSNNIKKDLLGLEPDEISHLYLQQQGMLDALNDGIIAIDDKARITTVNNSAIKMLDLSGEDVLGKEIDNVLPTCKLKDILESGTSEYYKEKAINDNVFLINRVPILKGDNIVGAIASFSDKTVVKRLAEEITGVNEIVEALRANTHEFMNKFHVILGLIELGELQEVKKFILDETEKQQAIVSHVIKNILDPTVAGLILGKISRAKELGINMQIEKESCLSKNPGGISSNVFVTILGNLIENAMEAVATNDMENRFIKVMIREGDSNILIWAEDNGVGISKENIDRIFNVGFTTKEGNRGRGLKIVREVIENCKGNIKVKSTLGEGTRFEVVLEKVGKNDKCIDR